MGKTLPTVDILGINVHAINMQQALEFISQAIERKEKHYICITNVHCIMECDRDASLKELYNSAGLVTPDGMPLVWLAKRRGYPETTRVYGPDLLEAFCTIAVERNFKSFFYGGHDGVAEKLANILKKRFKGLQISGVHSPPFEQIAAEEDTRDVEMINNSGADVVWVGLGAPKQERWMAEHRDRMDASVLIGIGAAFDFLSGNKKQAPKWLRNAGFEWLFRLLSEPGRLWKRYLVYNSMFVWKLLTHSK